MLGIKLSPSFTTDAWTSALLGGALIGLSATLMLGFLGRVAGISGIFAQASFLVSSLDKTVTEKFNDNFSFLLGLLSAGILVTLLLEPGWIVPIVETHWSISLLGGVLVGFGTRLGGGCTSGHGVCGLSRFSFRSFVATPSFILAGIFTVTLLKRIGL